MDARRFKRASFLLAAFALSLGSAWGVGHSLPPSELRVAALQRPNGSSPLLWEHVPTQSSILWSHDTAFEWAYLEGKPTLVPLLASERLGSDAAHRKFTLKIRSGVRLSTEGPARTLSAQHFVESWKQLAVLPEGSVARKIFWDRILALKVLDPLTLAIELKNPDPYFAQKLTLGFTSPAEGTGPWTLKTWHPGKKVLWQATRGYANSFYPTEGSEESHRKGLIPPAGDPQGLALPRTDELEQRWYDSEDRAFQDFVNGKLDLLPLSSVLLDQALLSRAGSSLKPSLSSRGIRLEQAPTHDVTLAVLNPRTLKDTKDRKKILSHLGPAFWQEALECDASLLGDSVLPVLMDWGVSTQKDPPSSAKSPGKGLKSLKTLRVDWATLDVARNAPESAVIALGSALERAGYQAVVEAYPLASARSRFEKGETDLLVIGWHWNLPNPEELIAPLSALLPADSRELHSIGVAAQSGSYPKLRKALLDAAVWSPGPRQRATVLLQPWIFGYKLSPLQIAPEKYLRVDRDLRRNYEVQSNREQ